MENASHEHTTDSVRVLIEQQTDNYSWDFVFLGANQDAVLTGAALGFDADSSMTYEAGAEGVLAVSASLSRYVEDVRGKSKRGFDRTGCGTRIRRQRIVAHVNFAISLAPPAGRWEVVGVSFADAR
jgi:hypothetical protein